MPSPQENRLINAELVLKNQERDLARKIASAGKSEAKEKKVLLKLMKGGDEELIDDHALLLASIRGQIKEMTKTKTNLHRFVQKVEMARRQQSIGTSMAAVSQALGSVTSNLKLDKFEQIMSDLSKQYDDIDVMTSVMETSTARATAKTVAQEEVDLVKRQVADEAGIELSQQLNSAEPVSSAPTKTNQINEDKLGENLKNIRAQAAT